MLATAILAGIVVLGCMAFYDVTAFDIEFHDSYIVVRAYQVLLLLLVGEFVALRVVRG